MNKHENLIIKISLIAYVCIIIGGFIYSFFDKNFYISLDNVNKRETKFGYEVIDDWETTVYAAGKVNHNLGYHYRVSFKHENGELYYADVGYKEIDDYKPGDKILVRTHVYTTKKGYIIDIKHEVKKKIEDIPIEEDKNE